MHQTKKGNHRYFEMKAHFGVDSGTKLIYAVVATPANVADSTVLPDLYMDGQSDDLGGGHDQGGLLLRRQRQQVSSGQCPRRPCAGRRSSLRPTSPRDPEGFTPMPTGSSRRCAG
jgi:hypothetical protein